MWEIKVKEILCRRPLVSILLLRACLKVQCRSWSVRGRDWGLACRRSYSPSSTMATGHGLGSLLICQTLLSVDRFPGGPGCKSLAGLQGLLENRAGCLPSSWAVLAPLPLPIKDQGRKCFDFPLPSASTLSTCWVPNSPNTR